MENESAVKYGKNSFWGKSFFAHYQRIHSYAPYRCDSCTVRKVVLFQAPWSWFFKEELKGTFFTPWMILFLGFLGAVFIKVPITRLWLLFVLGAMVAVVLVLLLLYLGIGLADKAIYWLDNEFLWSVRRAIGLFFTNLWNLLVKIFWRTSRLERLWNWYTEPTIFGFIPPWFVAVSVSVVVVQLYARSHGIDFLFWSILVLELVVIGIVIYVAIYVYFTEYFRGSAVANTISRIPYGIGRASTPVVKGTYGILTEWFLDIKNRVCKPVVWVDN